jgi:hypothetical protein
MHFLFNLLRIKGLYIFRALLAHLQEALHKRHLVYGVRVMSVGCYQDWSGMELTLVHHTRLYIKWSEYRFRYHDLESILSISQDFPRF